MKVNRNLIQICLLGAMLVTLPGVVNAQFTFTIDNGTITITDYSGPGGAMAISTGRFGIIYLVNADCSKTPVFVRFKPVFSAGLYCSRFLDHFGSGRRWSSQHFKQFKPATTFGHWRFYAFAKYTIPGRFVTSNGDLGGREGTSIVMASVLGSQCRV